VLHRWQDRGLNILSEFSSTTLDSLPSRGSCGAGRRRQREKLHLIGAPVVTANRRARVTRILVDFILRRDVV
jgi:hypothetical protein